MNRVIQNFLEILTGRITALIGSAIGTTVTSFRATYHAEQLAQLEELAQKYENEGKTIAAEHLRLQASRMEVDDPGSDARTVMENLVGGQQEQMQLENPETSRRPKLPTPTRRRRRRQTTDSKDDTKE